MMKNERIMNNCFFNRWKADATISLPFSKQNGETAGDVFGRSNASSMLLHISTIRGNETLEFVVAKSVPPERMTFIKALNCFSTSFTWYNICLAIIRS